MVDKTFSLFTFDRPEVNPGDWWKLGNSLLFCGDSTSSSFRSAIPKCLFGFADPPYGAKVADWDDVLIWDHDWMIECCEVVAVTPGIEHIDDFFRITTMPYQWILTCIIKNGRARSKIGFGNFIPAILFSHGSIFKREKDVKEISLRPSHADGHAHRGRKPRDFMKWLITLFTLEGDTVIDPFLGSGTTLVVAEETGRRCIGAEIDPVFCGRIIDRWQNQTGQEAVRI